MHLPITVAALLGQLIPRFRFAKQFANRALTQPENVLGEQSLTDVVYRQQLAHPPGYVKSVEVLRGVFVHIMTQHLLQSRLHRIALRYQGFAQSTGHTGGAELVAESEGIRPIVEPKRTLQRVENAQTADVIVRQMMAIVIVMT